MSSVYLNPGTILKDRYRIEKQIGRGGFGIIYEAYDLQLQNIVVVKEFFISRLMHRQNDSTEMEISSNKESVQRETLRLMNRFLSEARCMARLGEQSTIPNVYDFFEANHTAYIVMELLEGETLRQYLYEQKQPMTIDLAIFIISQVADALSALHKNGIIHRDIAPDNIFLCDSMTIQVKTLDLGAARLMDETDQSLAAVLKVGYSPVEQYDPSESHIGPWTDVYALGATLYFMLTGTKPLESTIRKKQDSLKSPHELRPDIPENISLAIMKAMAVEPKYRFQTVEAFMEALQGKRKSLPVEKEIRRHHLFQVAGVLLVLIVLACAGLFLNHYYNTKRIAVELNPADLSVWICTEPDSGEESAMNHIIEDFQIQFPHVRITLTVFTPEEYSAAIEKASVEGSLPDLFESSGISEESLQNACDLSSLLESDYVSDCLFLENYAAAYPNAKKFPLGIEIPIACIITSGDVFYYYSQSTFSDLNVFPYSRIEADPSCEALLNANFSFQHPVSWSGDGFLNASIPEYPIFLSSSMNLKSIRGHLVLYEKMFVPYSSDSVHCRYVYEWSSGSQTADQQLAIFRLLSWMTSESYQEALMITECSEGPLPINKAAFLEKADFLELPVLREIYPTFTFGEWQE